MSGTQYNCVQSIRDAVVWEPTLFSKIPSQNTNIEKGNRLEVATEIGLRRCGMEYENLTGWYHRGHLSDFETLRLLIECKNWYTDNYRITVDKVKTQILPRFTLSDEKMKVLIISECKWDSTALRLVQQNDIHIIEVPRVENDSDILWVAHKIQEDLDRVCRIDQYGTFPKRSESSNNDIFRKHRPNRRIHIPRSNNTASNEGKFAWVVGHYHLDSRPVRPARKGEVLTKVLKGPWQEYGSKQRSLARRRIK